MKRKIKIALALVLALVLMIPQQVYADGKLTVTTVSGKTGEQVAVEVCLTGDDVCSGNFNVRYDSEKLQLVSAVKGDGSWLGSVNERETGLVRVSFAQTEPLTDAVLCRLIFKVTADTPAEGTSVTLENARLYNKDSQLVGAELEFGSVKRDCVWYTLACGDTVEGQGVRAEVSLEGTLNPAGGSFTLVYDASILRATSVLTLDGLEGSQVTYNLDEAGVVKVAFASDTGIEGGVLCAVVFKAVGAAGTTAELELTEARAYDENSDPLDTAVSNGQISVVVPTDKDPKLWVVGGALAGDGTATASVVIQGRGRVCGGQFTLLYDSSITAVVRAESGVEVRQEDGMIHVSWARETPLAEAETLITVTFSNAVESVLTFDDNVRAYDSESKLIGVVDIRPGAITAAEQVHVTVDDVEVEVTENSAEVSVTVDLADANFFAEVQTEVVIPMLGVYCNGVFQGIALATEIRFENGVAEVSLSVSTDGTITEYRVFVMGDCYVPLCQVKTGQKD